MRSGVRVPGCLSPEPIEGSARSDKAPRGNVRVGESPHTVRIKVDLPEGSRKTTALIGRMCKRSNPLS